MTFRVGETVKLNSGGPLMTVEGPAANGFVICVWFDENNKPARATFLEPMLTREE